MNKKVVIGLFGSLLMVGAAHAQLFQYEAFDVADSIPGQDLWQYQYHLSGFAFAQDQGFEVVFDHVQYSGLQNVAPAVGGDWDIVAFEPIPELEEGGLYSAQALVVNPEVSGGFRVQFVWLGDGVPGEQSYRIFDTDFSDLEIGTTAPTAIPEPASMAAWVGLLMAGFVTWRRSRLR